MNTVLSSLASFLQFQAQKGIAPDLLARWTRNMETQVQVSAVGGEPIDGKPGCYRNGKASWWPIRIPKDAKTEPHFRDYVLSWPLDEHAHAIGSTGWDWVDRKSRWVGFDFDALTGHAAGHGIDDDELKRVRERAIALDYVETRYSTGGNGLHLYVFVDFPTANHDEHAGLARAVLGKMSADTGFDFASRVDCCGGNMWIWRRDVPPNGPGLSLIKASSRLLTSDDLPSWQDHIDVVRKRKTRRQVGDGVEALSQSRTIVALDETHRAIIDAILHNGYVANWIDEHHLLQTHTKGLAKVFEAGGVRGVFSTTSSGDDPNTPNCFMFPLDGGGWRVYRFSAGISEAPTWQQDGQGWTNCYFNKRPPFRVACLHHGGIEHADKDEFSFSTTEAALAAASCLGESIDSPPETTGRKARLSITKRGQLCLRVDRDKTDDDIPDWRTDRKFWERTSKESVVDREERHAGEYDPLIRQLVTPTGEDAGWRVASETGWRDASKDNVRSVLAAKHVARPEMERILGASFLAPWTIVNLPFQDEFPGHRQWNHGAAQLAYEPAEGDSPTWRMVMDHCGRDLDAYLPQLEWAREGILTGGDYLTAWAASLIRFPFSPLPYLFFFGPENTGKSSFHESLALLMTRGVVNADRALTCPNGFNGELANAVLAVVEEKNVAQASVARTRIRELVTNPTIAIRRMRTDTYTQANTTHWVQCANQRSFCPVFPGDTRITMTCVNPPERDIPKDTLRERLRAEAPAFLNHLLNLDLPEPIGRLRLPTIETQHKTSEAESQQDKENPAAAFMADRVMRKPGSFIIGASELYHEFTKTLPPGEHWTQTRFGRTLNDLGWPREKDGAGVMRLLNAAWSAA